MSFEPHANSRGLDGRSAFVMSSLQAGVRRRAPERAADNGLSYAHYPFADEALYNRTGGAIFRHLRH